jgi:hypothetical protein
MTQISRLASKQIIYLFESSKKSEFEKRILSEVIYNGLQNNGQFLNCNEEVLDLIKHRFKEYNLSVIGIQTNVELDIPLYTFHIEDYYSEIYSDESNWIKNATLSLINKYRKVWLRFYVDISDEQIEILMLKTGIPYF